MKAFCTKLICLIVLISCLTYPLSVNSNENLKFNPAMPVGFEENKGQFADESGKPVDFVLFRLSVGYLNLFLTEQGASYVFLKPSKHKATV